MPKEPESENEFLKLVDNFRRRSALDFQVRNGHTLSFEQQLKKAELEAENGRPSHQDQSGVFDDAYGFCGTTLNTTDSPTSLNNQSDNKQDAITPSTSPAAATEAPNSATAIKNENKKGNTKT
jgi:hypothetical protein